MSKEAAQQERRILVSPVPGTDRAKAIRWARDDAHKQGWGKTHLVSAKSITMHWGPARPGFEVTIEASEKHSYLQLKELRAPRGTWRNFRIGTRVRTLAPGHNLAGGARHTMPSGSVGVIQARPGHYFRVAFPELPGYTFVYTRLDLERLEEAA